MRIVKGLNGIDMNDGRQLKDGQNGSFNVLLSTGKKNIDPREQGNFK